MKKTGGIIVASCLVLGLIYFTTRPSEKSAVNSESSQVSQGDSDSTGENGDQLSARGRGRIRTATPGDASLGNDPRNEVITQQGEDFDKGDMQNVVVTDGMQIGSNQAFISRVNPNYKLFGVYVSQEEYIPQPFDTIVPNMTVTPGTESEVTLEVRTKPVDGDWTVWEAVGNESLSQPITLGSPAAFWQYRLTFYANDPGNSVKVQKVSIATRKSGSASLAASPNDLSVNNGQ